MAQLVAARHSAAYRALRVLRTTVSCMGGMLFSLAAVAGAMRVGPTRLEMSPGHPVAVLEVQNIGAAQTLAQLDTFVWTQAGKGDVLEPTTDLIATPLVLNLAPGETRVVRVGLRARDGSGVERSYRIFVREVVPTFAAQNGLQFSLRIGVPVFALTADRRAGTVSTPADLGWRWVPDIDGCANVQLSNPAEHYDRVIRAELLAENGEVLWESSESAYLLAGASRSLRPVICGPGLKAAAALRLITENRTIMLPAHAPTLIVDAHAP